VAPSSPRRTLILGAGWAGVTIARSALRHPEAGFDPVGFIDDGPTWRGRRCGGLPVLGDERELARAARRTGASALVVSRPETTSQQLRTMADRTARLGLELFVVPDLPDLFDRSVDVAKVRRLRLEDLVCRAPMPEQPSEIRSLVAGRVVMVIGATEVLGAGIARQLRALRPARIAMVDTKEGSMADVARELDECNVDEAATATAQVIEATDLRSLTRLVQESRPTIAFHVLADPSASANLIAGSRSTAETIALVSAAVEAARVGGVERYVLVTSGTEFPESSAQAAGRIAEMVVTDVALRSGRPYLTVRAGASFGAESSLVRRFNSQLEHGQPLTMRRGESGGPFMTVARASWHILAATTVQERGSVLELTRGATVPSHELAADCVRVMGRLPDSVPIVVDGQRHDQAGGAGAPSPWAERSREEVPSLQRAATDWLPGDSFGSEVRMIIDLGLAGQEQAFRTSTSALIHPEQDTATRRTREDGLAPAIIRIESDATVPHR
jgi:FlaA1/EpsC-like NDP-sugar epimerase